MTSPDLPPKSGPLSAAGQRQPGFVAALLDPDAAVPPGLIGPDGRPAGKRFDVYRNNVTVSLIDALEQSFPCIFKLVGEEFFRAMAREFLRIHPPKSPRLATYGDEMPGFLERFPPVAHLGYLPDVARLENALRAAYHAADAAPIDTDALGALPPERLMAARIGLAPAVRIVASDWPILAIWRANMADGPKPQMQAETVLVARPGYDARPYPLAPGAARFLQALAEGRSFGVALEAAGPELDLTALLQTLVDAQAMTSITEGTDDAGTSDRL
ncbi:HvfC/BufC N-terminal domain-containing protein [Frigidibacter sp. ROC022]|uniref:HvfC/BufC N-terminal domain-containing protein n=1 Tax=Frigidibacter sp. ROC022 TaxID=2971796 RepID=UPI00215ABD5E|nr:DNA-binding domain-containing protein [Frigidibacter sp. ROC022]MCR8723045.1 DNA-binding domain-containing protein [Frigidibacter sp. ROC022]